MGSMRPQVTIGRDSRTGYDTSFAVSRRFRLLMQTMHQLRSQLELQNESNNLVNFFGLNVNNREDGEHENNEQTEHVLPAQSGSKNTKSSKATKSTSTSAGKRNRPWNRKELKRLKKLLIKYPEERVEKLRYVKIAKELGNRTTRQVAKRVRKNNRKLLRANVKK